MKKVIDGDTMKCLETFKETQTEEIIKKYKKIGKWKDVSLDHDGDLILFKNI